MSSPKNLIKEGRSPSSNIQLDIEETMPKSAQINNLNSLQYQSSSYSNFSQGSNSPSSRTSLSSSTSFSGSNSPTSKSSLSSMSFSGKSSQNLGNDLMEGEVVPSKIQQPEEDKIPENKCRVKGHKKEDLSFICTIKDCDQILLCKKCKRKHKKEHQKNIKVLDTWFNHMFGRRVEDSDNNKVSRKCGMNLGKLQDLLKTFKDEIDARKQTIEKQTDQFIEMITSYIKQKHNESIKRLESHYATKNQLIEDYQKTYKKLKGLNRFTILENLKRQHIPNQEQPPLIPIQSIVRFLLENEKQYSDSSQIENQHKGFSKLIRDTDTLEQQINNEIKQFQKLAQTDEGKPDYMIRDSPIIQRIHDYIDFLYYFEKGIPKKPQSFFRSGTLNFDEEDYQNQMNSQSQNTSTNLSFTNQIQRMSQPKVVPGSAYRNFFANQGGGDTTRRRLTNDELLKLSRPREQSQSSMLKQIQQQDEGDFIIQKQKKQKEQKQNSGKDNCESEDDEKEEVEYECLVQENFNNAQFIDFKNDSIRVFGDQSVQLFQINGGQFNKKDNLKAQQNIISHDQEMYEIGAIEEVYFYQCPDYFSGQMNSSIPFSARGFESSHKISSDNLKNDSILADEDISQIIDLNSTHQLGTNIQYKKLPLLIIGLKSDPAKIEIWDMNKNEKIYQYLQAHDCSITCIQILEVIQNKSILFAVGSYDGIIKTWLFTCTNTDQILSGEIYSPIKLQPSYNLTQQLVMKCHTDFVTSMILFKIKDDPSKDFLISAGSDKKMIIWNWKNDDPIKDTSNQNIPPTDSMKNNTESSNGASSNTEQNNSQNLTVKQNIPEEGEPSSNETKSNPIVEEPKKKPVFLKKQIKLMSFPKNTATSSSSTNNADASKNSQNNTVNEKAMRKPLKIMDNVHSDKINCFEKLDEGYLASGSSDNTIKIWDMDTQMEQKVLQNKFIVNTICRLKRGTLVCSVNNVKMGIYLVNIWNWEQGQIIGVIKGHTNRITKIQVIPNLFGETTAQPIYNKIITCERNKVIRVWKQSNIEIDYGKPLNSQEDEMVNSPSSMRSHISRTYSLYGHNPAEEFLNMFHLEMDSSLTPINMSRITSQTSLPSGPYDKTPVNNLIRGAGFGQTTPQNSNLYFNSSQNSSLRNQNNPTFSQQNNIVDKQYYQIGQNIQQKQYAHFTPPSVNTTQYSSDEQQTLTQPFQQFSSSNSLSSPLLLRQMQITQPGTSQYNQQLNAQILQNSHQIASNPLNLGLTNISAQDLINYSQTTNIPLNSNMSNNIFQQKINTKSELQQAMEQVTIQDTLPENQRNFEQQFQINQHQNIAPTIDLLSQQGQQQVHQQTHQDQLSQRKRNYPEKNYQEIGHMLAPLEEANESEYNSPVDSQNDVRNPNESINTFTIDSTKFKGYSRENSNENNDISLYSVSPASKINLVNGNHQMNENKNSKIFKAYGPFSQIAERSPGSESSNSSGNYSDYPTPSLSKDGSYNANDIYLAQRNSASPNSTNYPKISLSGIISDSVVKSNSSENSPYKAQSINYSIKLNGVHKYGSLEMNGTPNEQTPSNDNTSTNNLNQDPNPAITNNSNNSNINQESDNLISGDKTQSSSNKNSENVNQQNLKIENPDQQKQEERQVQQPIQQSSHNVLQIEEKKPQVVSQSAPTSPSLPSNPPLSKLSALQKTKKQSSRNIFQN